ncbi:MAG: zinc ribbon domain-containing protein [Myxococcales bacterium]|nr:zinc ribbon domain-containing protein [Myxococcales bacterium]
MTRLDKRRHDVRSTFYERTEMPTYEYICTACQHAWEAFQPMSADPLRDCPKCNKPRAKRQISLGAGFILKGGGWYSDLYSSPSPGKGGGEGAGTGGGATSSPSTSGSSASTGTTGSAGSAGTDSPGSSTTTTDSKPKGGKKRSSSAAASG